jgi:hypothetical protein
VKKILCKKICTLVVQSLGFVSVQLHRAEILLVSLSLVLETGFSSILISINRVVPVFVAMGPNDILFEQSYAVQPIRLYSLNEIIFLVKVDSHHITVGIELYEGIFMILKSLRQLLHTSAFGCNFEA